MASSSAQEAAKAINLLMNSLLEDQQCPLEVIDDYLPQTMVVIVTVTQRMNKQVKYIHYYTIQNKRIRIIMDACICR